MKPLTLAEALDFYLESRRRLGFALVKDAQELGRFVRYAQEIGHTGPLSASLAMRWARQPQYRERIYWTVRLGMVRRFAQFWLAYDPKTEVPPPCPLARGYCPRPVHIYTTQQMDQLLEAAGQAGCVHPLRGWTLQTLLGLLLCTGMRIGEALSLRDSDIDWTRGVLTLRKAKGGHQRLIPIHPSTLDALRRYRCLRDKAIGAEVAARFFVTFRGGPLGYFGVHGAFCKLRQRLGWVQRPLPRLHDMRHYSAHRIIPSGGLNCG